MSIADISFGWVVKVQMKPLKGEERVKRDKQQHFIWSKSIKDMLKEETEDIGTLVIMDHKFQKAGQKRFRS